VLIVIDDQRVDVVALEDLLPVVIERDDANVILPDRSRH
jgi:hypothetical protein